MTISLSVTSHIYSLCSNISPIFASVNILPSKKKKKDHALKCSST